ncbi:hypothetical protein GIB67_010181, partial [Kingdonia uniflora]
MNKRGYPSIVLLQTSILRNKDSTGTERVLIKIMIFYLYKPVLLVQNQRLLFVSLAS